MKKTAALFMFLTLSASPLLADFCHHCGKELLKDANFCSKCGVAVSSAFETASETASVAETAEKTTEDETAAVTENEAEKWTADYGSINQMELALTSSNWKTADTEAAVLRKKIKKEMADTVIEYERFNQYHKKFHDLHIIKLNAIEAYLSAWKKENTEGEDRVQAAAEKDRALFMISKANEAIDTLITGNGNVVAIAKADDIAKRLEKTATVWHVTSKYLTLGGYRLNQGEPLWVIDVVGAEAKVLHMGIGRMSRPICDWISVYELEKRSSWRSDPAFFYSTPVTSTTTIYYEPDFPPPPPFRIILRGGRHYPYRYDRGPGPMRGGPGGRGPGFGNRMPPRPHRYVALEPSFW